MLAKMKMKITKSIARSEPVFRFRTVIAGDAVSKTVRGGLRACKDKPVETTIWRPNQLNEMLCIYNDINMYLEATANHRRKTDNFYL